MFCNEGHRLFEGEGVLLRQQGDHFDPDYMAEVRRDERIAGMQVYEFSQDDVFYSGVKAMLEQQDETA